MMPSSVRSSLDPALTGASAPVPVGAPPAARQGDTPRRLSVQEALACARETQRLEIGPGAIAHVPAVFAAQFPQRTAVVIADRNTWAIAGARVHGALGAAGIAVHESFVFDDPALYAEFSYVERLLAFLQPLDVIPVAVGSGTINDLVKLAAGRLGRPYLAVATAASMDGYTAFGASITFQGAKQTFDCPAPQAVVADTEVLRTAPREMTAAGYADLQAKITAGADWIVADALAVEPIEWRAWDIVQGGLAVALADPAGAREGKTEAIAPLTEGLMLGGFAMQWTKSSRPASGAEHQFSHLWDMEHHVHGDAAPAHGFKVGIATLAITSLYEYLLRQPIENLDVAACAARWPEPAAMDEQVRHLFANSDFLATALTETRAKHPSRAALRSQLELLQRNWPELSRRLQAQLVPFGELKRRLRAVGAPAEPEEIGISRVRLRDSFVRALHIRRRFTVLDLAARTGLLEPALRTLFGPGGLWAVHA